METLKKILAVLGSILAVIGAFFLLKKNEAPAKVAELETKVQANDIAIKSEESKREEIVKTAEEEKAKDVKPDEIIDFFNNRPKS
jgi:LEA14-like dessication related protein